MKREGISTLFIHGFPWSLSYLIDNLLLFEIMLCVVFEKKFKRRHRLGKLCNDPRS